MDLEEGGGGGGESGVLMTAPSLENHNYIDDYKKNFFLHNSTAQKIIMLINVKMPMIVDILTFIFIIYI